MILKRFGLCSSDAHWLPPVGIFFLSIFLSCVVRIQKVIDLFQLAQGRVHLNTVDGCLGVNHGRFLLSSGS